MESSTNELFLFLAGFTFAGEALSVCAKEILLLCRVTSQSRVSLFVVTVPMFEAGVQKLLFEWCSRDSKVIPFKTAEECSVRQVGGGAK